MPLSVVIHGHFYQPPRENPFLDEVESEPSAAPYHDWNQRIERECYRAVAAARVSGAEGRIARVVNTLESISFNFGPTLLEWLEREARDTYEAVLAADRASVTRLKGHGNAIAQPYHHTILPLASRRDKVTEVRWGIADFRRRFGREPEGMWLPETAVDDETLDVLATEGIGFTILAPRQVSRVPRFGQPGRYRTANGNSIALFVYHDDLAHGIAFGGLLHDAGGWVEKMLVIGEELAVERRAPSAERRGAASEEPPVTSKESRRPSHESRVASHNVLLSAATDGETYGHHHRFGEMALARALEEMGRRGSRLENFASFLARVPPVDDIELVAPSSWSCAHGVERWRSDCGCRLDGARNPSQAWRAPLRSGLERLAAEIHKVFEREGKPLFADPWRARDAYGAVVAGSPAELALFAAQQTRDPRTPEELVRARELLEMERDALRMFTSCAWFFDDIGGLEPRQILRYAARAIELAGGDGAALEAGLLDELKAARSNNARIGNAADMYRVDLKPRLPAAVRIAAAAIAGRHASAEAPVRPGSASVELSGDGQVRVVEWRTGRARLLRARVMKASPVDLVTQVEDERGVHYTVDLAQLPERPRHAIRSRLRRSILPRCLTPDELELLVAGDATLGGLVRVALLRTIRLLETDHAAEVVELAGNLLDLLDQFEARIPFDAQTAFWRIWLDASPSRKTELGGLFWRLGFTSEEFQGDGPAD